MYYKWAYPNGAVKESLHIKWVESSKYREELKDAAITGKAIILLKCCLYHLRKIAFLAKNN